MFQFTGFPSIHYGFMYGYMRFAHVGFPIQISPDQCVFAAPRSFSQLITSFFGSQCQGIRPAPFLALPLQLLKVSFFGSRFFYRFLGSRFSRCSRYLCVQFSRSDISLKEKIWQPPVLPCRLQHSTFGRPGLNRRVRDGYGCFPGTHRHQKSSLFLNS